MWVLAAILLILSVAIIVVVQRGGGFGFPWLQFYVRGKESGFKFSEINLLRRIAVDNKLKNPTALFWSERVLDRCIRGTVLKHRSDGNLEDESTSSYLAKLFEFRKRVEFALPKYQRGIDSSRSITQRQVMKITFPGSSVYVANVIESNRRYMAISYPKGRPLPPGFTWQGQRIQVYFWRAEDAGYYFESQVIGDFIDRKVPIIHIKHSDRLTRSQKRQSVRAQLNATGQLFPLRSIQQTDEVVESSGGYRCRGVDISEDGAAVMVGGRAKPGIPVKLQFRLSDSDVVLCGTVRSVTFKQSKNVSILHIQAVRPSLVMRNRILVHVYGLFSQANSTANVSKVAAQMQERERQRAAKAAEADEPDGETADSRSR